MGIMDFMAMAKAEEAANTEARRERLNQADLARMEIGPKMDRWFLWPAFALMANILAVLSVLIYGSGFPPHWMAYPVPVLLFCLAVGVYREVVLGK